MNTPFPLLFLALMFWGILADQWAMALVMALFLDGSRFIPWRWHPEDRDLHRVADLGSLILGGLLLYPHVTGDRSVPAVLYEMQVLPYALFPLMLAQAYAVQGVFPLSGLFYTLRKGPVSERRTIPLDHLFFGACLIAASAGLERSPWYFPGVMVLLALALWPCRPKRYAVYGWVVALLLAGGVAHGQQQGMATLQRVVGDRVADWLGQWLMGEVDPYRRGTALGEVGALKLSESILFRVDQPHPWTMPLLLREVSYSNLVGNMWFAPPDPMRELPIETRVGAWTLVPGEKNAAAVTVYRSFGSGAAMIAAPQGVTRLEGLLAMEMAANGFGAIRAKKLPPFLEYKIHYDPHRSFDTPPAEADLAVPKRESPAIRQVAAELGLDGLPPRQVLARLERFFIDQFRYTVTLAGAGGGSTPIGRFLLENRAGHCEYFAAASVLLLRQAGIPARYVFGYSVQEAEGRLRVVRKRHAHAWASAFVDGVWLDVDNTPPDWQGMEEKSAPWWRLFPDLWSRVWFEFDRYRQSSPSERSNWPWLVLLLLLAAILAYRTVRGKGGKRLQSSGDGVATLDHMPPFQRIERHLVRQGWPRDPAEPLGIWLRRIHRQELLPLLALHYRSRFDPRGVTREEQMEIERGVATWIDRQTVAGVRGGSSPPAGV